MAESVIGSVVRRVADVSDTVEMLVGVKPSLCMLRVDPYNPSTGQFKLRVRLRDDVTVDIYESYVDGVLQRYSYALIIGGRRVLGYDNAPHHRSLDTFPHHKHVGEEVYPLNDNSVSAFIREALQVLSLAGRNAGQAESPGNA